MRLYFFGNMYLSSIQQGIQAAHVAVSMFIKYDTDGDSLKEHKLFDWAENHKTMILLNGGYGSNLHDLIDFFAQDDNPYPFSFFKESEGALDNALTSVGIILPETIYEGARVMRKLPPHLWRAFKKDNKLAVGDEVVKYTNWEVDMMERLNKFRLAQ